MTIIKAGLIISHDITLVLFQWIIKNDFKNKYLHHENIPIEFWPP